MKKEQIIVAIFFILSLISGILSHDLIIGGTILFSGLLCAYLGSIGKKSTYTWGLINYLLMGIVSFKNNLFGIFFFYIFIFSPLQIQGYFSWNKNYKKDKTVKVREFTLKNSIIITSLCILGSILLGFVLSLIPSQVLSFMDSTSNCINLCGVILMIMRFKEAWWIWLINNVIDLIIWILMVINQGNGAIMMLLVSIGYLLINIYGMIKWQIEAKKNS